MPRKMNSVETQIVVNIYNNATSYEDYMETIKNNLITHEQIILARDYYLRNKLKAKAIQLLRDFSEDFTHKVVNETLDDIGKDIEDDTISAGSLVFYVEDTYWIKEEINELIEAFQSA